MTETAAATGPRKARKVRHGQVVSNKMDKTVIVAVVRKFRHPLYKKFVQRTKRYYAHDALNACNVGDEVQIAEIRPMSKTKRWRVDSILKKAR